MKKTAHHPTPKERRHFHRLWRNAALFGLGTTLLVLRKLVREEESKKRLSVIPGWTPERPICL